MFDEMKNLTDIFGTRSKNPCRVPLRYYKLDPILVHFYYSHGAKVVCDPAPSLVVRVSGFETSSPSHESAV